MRTLIVISHPTTEESPNRRFFKEASSGLPVTWHHLESSYPGERIGVKAELQLLAQHDRIIFRFPFYWYNSLVHLKVWQDNVLEQATRVLEGKELGIVLTIGVAEKEYQTGRKEEYTISEFLRLYHRIANKFHVTYLSLFILTQFMYLSQERRWEKLIAYRQYLSLERKSLLTQRIDWFVQRIQENQKMQEEDSEGQTYVAEAPANAKERAEGLSSTLQEMKGTPL